MSRERSGAGALAAEEQVSNQGYAHIEGDQEQIFQQAGALLGAIPRAIAFRLLGAENRGDVLQEIDAALLASPAVPLFVFAGGALKAQRGVASRAEPRYVTGLGAAFGAL